MVNPIQISPRFEIRKLELQHLEWAKAIISHSNVFHSPAWAKMYPDDQAERFYKSFDGTTTLVLHQINSGLSYGVFDTEYEFTRPESAETGGGNYWDLSRDPNLTGDEILQQMDFPLASIALAYDAADPLDFTSLTVLFEALPDFPHLAGLLTSKDTRDPATWQAKGPNEVLSRMGTATRADYMHIGITKTMAHWLMWDAAERGFRGIGIECFHDAVHHIWTNPPAPFKADLIAKITVDEYEKEGKDGEKTRPYPHVTQALSKVYVHLK
ncbi:hypothetical protein BJX70DRAFT_269168 [Aspergillus crustosus]